jgi:hypothetical protein
MRLAIIVSAVIGLIAGGTAIYGLLDEYAPSPTSELTTSVAETSKSDRAGLFDASDEAPRVRIGDLIILPPFEPEILTGSVKPTAKPGQAKKAKPRKQTQTPKPAPAANAAARKPAPAQPQSNPSPTDLATLALTGNAE